MNKKHYKPIKIPARLGFLSYLGDVQGCGTIRVIQPFLLLNHYRSTKNVQVISQTLSHYIFEPEYYKNFTFCQFQRSATEHHFKLFLHFKSQVQKKFNVPIVYEIDDMLIGIPDYNYATKYYTKNEEWVKKCMGLSDAMITSTPQLKKVYAEYCNNISVIPNHLPKFIWGDIYPAHDYYDGEKIKILWSGSQNHFSHSQLTPGIHGGDFGQKLLNFITKTTDKYDWYFVGSMPNELIPVKDKICFLPWQNIFEYPNAVKTIEPDIAIAPLVDNPFNACKSNIKMLEFTAMGAAGIYSNVMPYHAAKIKTNTDEEMISEIERLAADTDARRKTFQRDYSSVRAQLWWEEANNVKNYINTYLGLFKQRLP